MSKPTNKNRNWAIAFGIAFLIFYLFLDFFWQQMWLFSLCPLIFFAVGFLVFVIKCLLKKERIALLLILVVILCIAGKEVATSETFKSPVILYAALNDDRSVVYLRLRENKTFEVNVASILSSEDFTGKFNTQGNKIIFLNKHFYDDFIPDTLTIGKDKIYFQFDSTGKPIATSANYFTIIENKIK